MREHSVNELNNFIAGWYIKPEVCDALIQYHKNSPNKKLGTSGDGIVNLHVKDSYDVNIFDGYPEHDSACLDHYRDELQLVADEYKNKYPWCNISAAWGIQEGVNIQHYPVFGGFHSWHSERLSAIPPICNRHLVFMTYLNDVTDGGQTQFYHQNLLIKPEKGLTLIWPADWTFTHRGVPSETQEKYIITGWYNFL